MLCLKHEKEEKFYRPNVVRCAVDLEGVRGQDKKSSDDGGMNRVLNNNEILLHISDSNQLALCAPGLSPCYSISIFISDTAVIQSNIPCGYLL